MPISKENKDKYPPDWDQIRERILARAGNRCERCGVVNGVVYRRLLEHPEVAVLDGSRVCGATLLPPVNIVLTIAHLDSDLVDHDDDNLAALCQRCHNLLDGPSRRQHAAETRARRSRQGELF